jgi:catechol-2,3-dioxygenase
MPVRSIPTSHPVAATLSHVVLRTAHLDETIAFYEQFLGMHANYRGDDGAALSNDHEHHRIALGAVRPGEQNGMAPGLEHLAFKIGSIGDLLGNYQRLKTVGVLPFMTIHHGGTLSAYYLDPDGAQVETFIDTQIADLSIEEMSTDQFNTIGIPVDFDDLTTRFQAGESIASLLEPPVLQEGQLAELIGKIQAARGMTSA